ncbi:MAG TPA: nicotinate-nucleotide adenylyltransferase [Syntrophobacteria bacterium]|nr:nicotinate-nucleotide adenylyltransferase [Syntrophobacteria bacterium]
MRAGILGGTFDPVHFGHLRAAEEVADSLNLSTVIFMPAAKPPHKKEHELTPFAHRWRMLELALAGNSRFVLSDLEYRRPGESYSVETLAQLLSQYGRDALLYFIVGLDAFVTLPTWHRYRDLFSLCQLVVVARPGHSPAELDEVLHAFVSERYRFDQEMLAFVHPEHRPVYVRQVTLMDISSSRIREDVAGGRSVRYLLPVQVEDYIREQRLYGSR